MQFPPLFFTCLFLLPIVPPLSFGQNREEDCSTYPFFFLGKETKPCSFADKRTKISGVTKMSRSQRLAVFSVGCVTRFQLKHTRRQGIPPAFVTAISDTPDPEQPVAMGLGCLERPEGRQRRVGGIVREDLSILNNKRNENGPPERCSAATTRETWILTAT